MVGEYVVLFREYAAGPREFHSLATTCDELLSDDPFVHVLLEEGNLRPSGAEAGSRHSISCEDTSVVECFSRLRKQFRRFASHHRYSQKAISCRFDNLPAGQFDILHVCHYVCTVMRSPSRSFCIGNSMGLTLAFVSALPRTKSLWEVSPSFSYLCLHSLFHTLSYISPTLTSNTIY